MTGAACARALAGAIVAGVTAALTIPASAIRTVAAALRAAVATIETAAVTACFARTPAAVLTLRPAGR